MKKFFVIFSLIVVLLVCLAVPTFGTEPQTSICAKDVVSLPGATVTMNITVNNNPGIMGCEFTLRWDERLSLTEVSSGEAFFALTFTPPASTNGKTEANFVWDAMGLDAEDVKDGVILTLTFEVDVAVSDVVLPVTFSYAQGNIQDASDNPVDVAFINGSVSVISYTPGDVNGDGKINANDVRLIRQYISDGRQLNYAEGYNVYINELAADVTGDGVINTADITRIRRFISDGCIPNNPDGYCVELLPSPFCKHTTLTKVAEYKAPTCTEAGHLAYWQCENCGKYYQDEEARYETTPENSILGTIEHTPGQWMVDREATCSQEGTKHQICSVCGTTIGTAAIPVSGHSYAAEWSCDDTYHWYAATCEHANEVKNKVSHRWDEGVVTSNATVYDEGVKVYTCQDCEYAKEEEIPQIASFTVVFYDFDNKIILKSNYELNTASSQIAIPSIQAEAGLQFEDWVNTSDAKSIKDVDFSKAKENAVYQFKPTFAKTHEVIFIDYEGKQLGETRIVRDGETLQASDLPAIPERTGYTSRWDEQVLSTKITETKVFSPVYEVTTFNVVFLNEKNGTEIARTVVEYGSFAMIPEHSLYRFDDKLYGFTGWKSAATDAFVDNVNGNKIVDVYSDVTVYAVYEESIEQPVLAVHIDGTTVTMSLCMPEETSLYSINLSVGWKTEKGICEVVGATISSVTPLNRGNCGEENCTVYTDKTDWLVYNNKAKTIDFIWNCGNGHAFTTSKNVITLVFGVDDGAQITESMFSMLEGSNVVCGASAAGIHGLSKANISIWFY